LDERYAFTEESIRIAFFQLMDETGFQKINIQVLTKRAGINRTTFYLHYKDKYDLLDKVEDHLLAGIREIVGAAFEKPFKIIAADKTFAKAAVQVLCYIKEHAHEFGVLLEPPEYTRFLVKYGRIFDEILHKQRLFSRPKLTIPYLVAILSGAHTNIIREWIKGGLKESPEELAAIISRVAKAVLKEVLK
jgi:AcrR family transcriptional regulator